MKTGLIILGHGSRIQEAAETLADITATVKKMVPYEEVEYAFFQFSKPDLSEATNKLIRSGINRIFIIPALFASGKHLTVDIPQIIDKLKVKNPGVKMYIGEPLGADLRIVEILLDRIRELETSI
ncbi:MAG: CbiX/SirB N-terminal domain-containing protein [Bacillota bacterium]